MDIFLNFIYKVYFFNFKNTLVNDFYSRVIIRFGNIVLPVYFSFTRKNKNFCLKESVSNNYIVSLTTFPGRIDKVWLTIESILRQNIKPDSIILWLYEGEFQGKNSLPNKLLNQVKRGLKIRFVQENLMPHKKYIYAIRENKMSCIITVDDDILYPPNLIHKLIKSNKLNPNNICAPICRKIEIHESQLSRYSNWKYNKNSCDSGLNLLPIGAGSVLYPPESLSSNVYDIENLVKLALRADDLWLKIMSTLNGTKVNNMGCEFSRFFLPVLHANKTQLMDLNIGEGQNDRVIKDLMNFYNINVKMLE